VSSRIAESYRKRFGLKIAEWRLIAILAESDQMTPQALGEATRMDKISVSRAAAALVVRELVCVKDNPSDGRSHYLLLTDSGRSLHAEIAPAALAMEAELLTDFTHEERAILDKLLRRLSN
jgi:DNA-binding MarR family transcriptional regulator